MRVTTVRLVALTLATLCSVSTLHAQRRSKTLSAEEIEKSAASLNTAYDAVETLRPRWLQVHELAHLPAGPSDVPQSTPIYVYVNDVKRGGVDYLKTIPASSVEAMRWLDANEAGSRYGPTDGGVAIVVSLKH